MNTLAGVIGLMATGGSSSLDAEQITVGGSGGELGYNRLFYGAISDGLFAPKGGAQIQTIKWVGTTSQLVFNISGTFTNDGWTTMAVGAFNYLRTSASFSTSSGTSWSWGTGNPFGTTPGAMIDVIFT